MQSHSHTKPFLAAILLALFVLCGTVTSLSAQTARPPQDSIGPRLVTTTGEAEVLVTPDEVILTLGVETANSQLSAAKQENDKIVGSVKAAAQRNGVAAKDLKTDHISIEPRYRDSYERRDFLGYYVRQTIVVTLKEIAAFDAVLADVLGAGATHVHGVQFRTTELRKHRDAARSLAIRAAREKAAALAQELGQEIGQPHDIREDQSQWWSWYNSWWGGRGSAMSQNVVQNSGAAPEPSEGSIAPGQISVTARVTVSFEMK